MNSSTRFPLLLLCIVGFIYLTLGVWCAASPDSAATFVGFGFLNPSGKSEFISVYGGLEVGLGLGFLSPILYRDFIPAMLAMLITIHGSLAAFRGFTICFMPGLESSIFLLAAVEGVLFVLGVAALRSLRSTKASAQ